MSALRDGVRRVHGAPAILIGMWLLAAATLPLALTLRSAMVPRRGSSEDAGAVARGGDWTGELDAQAAGVGVAASTVIVGFRALLDGLGEARRSVPIVAAAGLYLALWLFFTGGILDRYARDRPTRAYGFFSACGGFLLRFFRLGIVMVVVYGFLFGWMHPWLFDRLYPRMTRATDAEGATRLARLSLDATFFAVLAGCNLIFDYAKVRAVVEDRRSMFGAIAAAVRFIGSHYAAAVSLYVADILLFAGVFGAYALLAPARGAGAPVWLAAAIGQGYILARLWVTLVFWASETSLFQSRLAHAGYIARRAPTWPDSPAAEAMERI